MGELMAKAHSLRILYKISVPYQEFLAYSGETMRVKFGLASARAARWFGVLTRADRESLWRALPLSD